MTFTFYWHDYETWGADPRKDRAAQFAGIRTDAALNVIGKPLSVYCKPSDDLLPQPEACLVTGITPQKALEQGVNEAEFFSMIHLEIARPGTCGVGYNSVRFDDEFTRFGFYRNFHDPYAREWQNGNSRWDIIDMVRLTHALRPEGVVWPRREDGAVSFRLEALTEANGIAHQAAHDALSDVYATIELAKLIQQHQPRLFSYLLSLRNKRTVGELLNLQEQTPVLHVSSMYPAEKGCIAMVMPLARHPTNPNGVIVYDLGYDPDPLIQLGEEEIQMRLFTPREHLPPGVERIPLKTIHLNKCPVVVPMSTLTDQAAERWGIDLQQGLAYLERIKLAGGVAKKIQAVHARQQFEPITDPDQSLYSGAFFSKDDRNRMNRILTATPEALAEMAVAFDDPRLPEMLFRYRARNWPETLSPSEVVRWQEYRVDRLTNAEGGSSITLKAFQQELARLMVDPTVDAAKKQILSELADWPAVIRLV
ncbi:exodeoxyribonuclease I [Sedimenticola selenatireducens]|uniref:Exodeoxyribonuclease I n=1 Tax=Sedimenticola selenatireducens TaxID=191960 RepID=A0A558E0G6_9GAMM|nr:exodeoxyribonuclease I [Sedimenticola selenatireducens]TVO75296.1 exodeoxyribonuclease I [Sedimenticola selenatireducens]TVT66851.1 MAG: exodeoxyribonuclease I [Sedimenticola selenatireducens]